MNFRTSRAGMVLRIAVCAALAFCLSSGRPLAAGSPIPELTPSPHYRGEPPMRVLRVASSDPACGRECPEWISVEGIITPGSAATFARLIADLGGRRLPVLISSHGGSVREALEMGRLIRAKGLAVAVARTFVANCPERARVCPDARGQAIVGGATCASACPLVLAGGVERLIGPTPLVGVHQITTIMKEIEGAERPTKTIRIYEQDWVDKTVENYLTMMGVGDPVMTLLRKTPATSIRWLSPDEIRSSGLATEELDLGQPILVAGANGLNGRSFDTTARPDLFTATAENHDGAGSKLALTYRRGGGALEVALTGAGAKAAGGTMTAGGGGPLPLKPADDETARGLLSRDRFCEMGRDSRVVVTPAASAAPSSGGISFDFAPGVQALLGEACP